MSLNSTSTRFCHYYFWPRADLGAYSAQKGHVTHCRTLGESVARPLPVSALTPHVSMPPLPGNVGTGSITLELENNVLHRAVVVNELLCE